MSAVSSEMETVEPARQSVSLLVASRPSPDVACSPCPAHPQDWSFMPGWQQMPRLDAVSLLEAPGSTRLRSQCMPMWQPLRSVAVVTTKVTSHTPEFQVMGWATRAQPSDRKLQEPSTLSSEKCPPS